MYMLNTRFLLVPFLLFALVSCERKEKPITLPPKGDGSVMQVEMGDNYEYQFFINLQQEKIVHVSRIDQWDLAFQSEPSQHAVFLNGGKGMAVYPCDKANFEDVNYSDTLKAKANWRYDAQNGSLDSTAIGEWKGKNPVFIVKLNESGTKLRKLQLLSENAFQYTIAVGDIASTVPYTIQINRNLNCNFTYFSFDLLNTVDQVEPGKNAWDIQVTRFNYTFYEPNPPLRYIVNGVLLNPTLTKAYKDSVTDYNLIDEAFALSAPLSSDRNVIGFDWKTYNIDQGLYTIVRKYNYIIKTQQDQYFKMHFLDFYSSTGVKGSPKFEFFRLK